MFDVFYSGTKPGAVAYEREANSLEHAQQLSRTEYFWWITYLADLHSWDWFYVPAPWQAGQRHAWPSQWQKDSGVYLVPKAGYTETNYHTGPVIQRLPDATNWTLNNKFVNWDTSWHPDPSEPDFVHEFATQWWDQGGPVYAVPGATAIKYHAYPKAELCELDHDCVQTLTNCEWNYAWQPHPKDPPYIYVFGNQWWPGEVFPTVKYTVPGATEVKYVSHPKAILPERHCNRWNTLVDCNWDYSWVPDPGDAPYIYVFGNQHWPAEIMPTVEYAVPGATERKFMSWPRAALLPTVDNWTVPAGLTDVDLSWCPDPGDPPMTYQFGTQWQRTGGPVYTVPGSTEVKYVSSPRAVKTNKDSAWSVPDGVDTSTFDWTWHPDATEPPYIYQFGTQHQRTGGPQYTVADATKVKYVDQIRIKTVANAAVIYEIDHLDNNAGHIPNTVKRVRYFDNYRDTLIRLAKSIGTEHEFVWICSSICDYTDFDFSWHPEQWQATMLHVFSSDDQKFGDTFYMHVPTFAARAEKKALLEWYDVNFIDYKIPRRCPVIIQHTQDSHVEPVKTTNWPGPVAVFTNTATPAALPAVNLWSAATKTIIPLNASASTVVVPKNAIPSIKTQLYDYTYIDKSKKKWTQTLPQDVIFISYDEPDADQNWKILKDKCSRAQRVHGVAGMELALEAAADVSTTPWYYAVFAKTRLHDGFDFSFAPDYMQQPKNYIFNCHNRVNGLEYGHMGIVMYNCQGIKILNQQSNFGLDYTLSFPNESIPILSCYGDFDQTPYHTWRTAFRECTKLSYFESETVSVDGAYRLRTWLEKAQGPYAEWCLRGAADGVEFFNSSNKQIQTLKQSFKWEWLRSYFESRYGKLE